MKLLLIISLLFSASNASASNSCRLLFAKELAPATLMTIGTILNDVNRITLQAEVIKTYEVADKISFSAAETFSKDSSPFYYLENLERHHNAFAYNDNFKYEFNFVLSNLKLYRESLRKMVNSVTGASRQSIIDELVEHFNDVEKTVNKYELFEYISDGHNH